MLLHSLVMCAYSCRFAYLRKCGCVISDKALREVSSETCHKVGHCHSVCTSVLNALF